MSFIPTLIIKASDLDKLKDEFDTIYTCKNKDEKRILQYLQYVHERHYRFKIDDIEMILCEPEFTAFNALVREKLTECNVQFATSY